MALRRKLFPLLRYAICFAGCLYQVSSISKTYFAYDSKTTVSITIVDTMKIPTLSTCWDLKTMMDFDGLNRDQGIAVPNTTEKFYNLLDTMTVRQIFNYTPMIDSIIERCLVRLPQDYAYRQYGYNSSECLELFHVEKYIHRQNICYKKTTKLKSTTHIIKQTLNPVEGGLIYKLYFSSDFNTTFWYNAIIHSIGSSMLFDGAYSPFKYIFLGNKSLAMDVTFYPTEISYLPAPYETKCISMNFSSGGEMVLKSIREKFIQKFSLVDTLAPIFTPYDYPMITRTNLRNKTFVNLFRPEAEKAENPPCSCTFEYIVTRIYAYQNSVPKVSVYWPQDSRNDIHYFPSFSATDYVIYVCSSIGIWFGLSVLSLFDMIRKVVTPDTVRTYQIEPTGQSRGSGNIECRLLSTRHTLRWQMVSIERLTNQNYQLTNQINRLTDQNSQLLNNMEKLENRLTS